MIINIIKNNLVFIIYILEISKKQTIIKNKQFFLQEERKVNIKFHYNFLYIKL